MDSKDSAYYKLTDSQIKPSNLAKFIKIELEEEEKKISGKKLNIFL